MWNDFKRLRKAEDRLDELERQIKALDLEFSALYDKVRTMVAKWAKRIERAQQEGVGADSPAEPETPVNGMTADQRRKNDEIMARRANRAVLPR